MFFCGDSAGSREHIFPNWLSRQYGDIDSRVEIEQGSGKLVMFDGKIFRQVTKKVCKQCNNGWMGEIEGRVNSYLGDMALEKNLPVLLDAQRQHDLALWVQKTLLVVQSTFSGAERNASAATYSEMYDRKDVILPSATFIGFSEQGPAPGTHAAGVRMYQISRANIKLDDKEYLFRHGIKERRFLVGVLRLGHVNFHVILSDMHDVTFRLRLPYGGYIQLISPAAEHAQINWPATFPVELVGGWNKIHTSFADSFFVERA